MDDENVLIIDKHVLICPNGQFDNIDNIYKEELDFIKDNFCGVFYDSIDKVILLQGSIIYLCGNIEENIKFIVPGYEINIIRGLSYNYDNNGGYNIINIGEIPININNVGILFRKLFSDENYFHEVKNAHEFQLLTEGNKEGHSFRKGIYLTNVNQENDEIHFNLLRCSTNLNGPTENFRDIDKTIVNKVNNVCKYMFQFPVNLNHVLAQIYENVIVERGQKKASIKAHSDKTKDMPRNGLLAFTTFYDTSNISPKHKPNGLFDICYNNKNISALTSLHFKLKNDASLEYPNLVREFNVLLYPNSVFIIPLSTNRLYTHEIRPSCLPIDKMFRRLGYVIRCSNTGAIYKDNQTYIINDKNELIKLEPITKDNETKIRELYLIENKTHQMVSYNNIYFSMNKGDYMKPIV